QQVVEFLFRIVESPFLRRSVGEAPVRTHPAVAVDPLQKATGRKFLNAMYHRKRCRNVIEAQKAIQCIRTDLWMYRRMLEYCFKLGAKENAVACTVEEQRFYPNAIPGEHEPSLGLDPNAEAEHAAKVAKAIGIPNSKRV